MGIKGLMPFISDSAPSAVKETKMEAMTGRVIAIDASMCLYQFLVAVRQADHANLSNAEGEVTSHLQGFLSRTVRLLECGVKPLFVFDGKPPEAKLETLSGRTEKKKEAEADLEAAREKGDEEEIRKASHRTAKATPQMNADVQQLLRLLGVPVVLAPSEAEASCAALCKAGVAYATATEDMDALTFGTTVMLKNFFDTESSRTGQKRPVFEITLARTLEQLDISMPQFVDFCIMCGCDYAASIRGVGPTTAFKLLKQHGSLEAAVRSLGEDKAAAVDMPRVADARTIFLSPEVVDPSTVQPKWTAPDEPGVKAFLVERHAFNEARVDKALERLRACRASGTQSRLDSFFMAKAPKPLGATEKFDPFKKKAASASKGPASFKRGVPSASAQKGGKAKAQKL